MRKIRFRRLTASFLLVLFIGQMAMPTISYALTSGPTAPEYTSFEPVDTTDMVNLNTGDLVYNMPLLEVPGPEGGFPLSLSYHSGITLEEEASWVGLGWTLNSGAITRTVNGNPDDQIGVSRKVQDYNIGGDRNTFSVGIGTPGTNFGLDVAFDSNLGVGIGFSASVSLLSKIKLDQISKGIPIPNPSIGGGVDAFGGSYVSAGVSIRAASGLSAGVGLQTNFSTVGGGGQFGYNGLNIGASITSQGVRATSSVSGFTFNQVNSHAGRITTEGFGFSIPIPIGTTGLFANLGYKYLRYYSDEKSAVNVIGSLHAEQTNGKSPDDWTFDSYALLDPDQNGGIVKKNDPEMLYGGSFPAYDQYMVNSQGVSGSIQPYIFDNGTLFRQNVTVKDKDDAYLIKYNPIKNSFFGFSRPVNFRFKNDFSNALTYDRNEMQTEPNGDIFFQNEDAQLTPPDGYNTSRQMLAGSKHIEWFTNTEVLNGVGGQSGLMNYQDDYVLADRAQFRNYNVSEQVGAFMITNESGVTYHYALPVYAYEEQNRIVKIDNPGIFHKENNPHPYAYTWLLTAITGPDFVDRNGNGNVDETDWGYWVKFDYGLWSSGYTWRNPGKGFHIDLDSETKMFSFGEKQLMYLNKISTRTHSAYFIKSIRKDGKSSSSVIEGNGLFKPYLSQEVVVDENGDVVLDENGEEVTVQVGGYPSEQLKLDRIILVTNEDALRLGLDAYKGGIPAGGLLTNQFDDRLDEITKSAIRTMNLAFSYDLGIAVDNSFEQPRDDSGGIIYDSTGITLTGKLTLESLNFIGKGGVEGLIPPVTFEYGKNEQYSINHSDMWGNYKKDFVPMDNQNLERFVTNESAQYLDAWSMTRVVSSLGAEIEIEYEPDSYSNSSINNSTLLQLRNPVIVEGTTDEILFQVNGAINEGDLEVDIDYDPVFLLFYKNGRDCRLHCNSDSNPNSCDFCDDTYEFNSEIFTSPIRVTEVTSQGVKVKNKNLYDKLKPKEIIAMEDVNTDCETCPSASITIYNNNYHFLDGVLKPSEDVTRLGGGIRVKKLVINSANNESFITNFDYSENGTSSGATSYEPVNLVSAKLDFNDDFFIGKDIETLRSTAGDNYLIELQKNYSKLLAITRELPGPGVMYSKVTLSDEICHGSQCIPRDGKKVFEFQTYQQELVQRTGRSSDGSNSVSRCVIIDPDTGQEEPVNCGSTNPAPQKCYNQAGQVVNCGQNYVAYSPTKIQDFSSWLGALKRTAVIGADGQVLTESVNHFLHDGLTYDDFISALKTDYGGQGIISQIFNENKALHGDGSSLLNMYVFSRKDEYPLVPLGQTTTNYKTGVTTTTTNKKFDFYTGIPLKVESSDSYGNRYLAVAEPAYYHYPGMGLKVNDPTNRHMLTQPSANYSYKLTATGTLGSLLSATAQTWNDEIAILNQEIPQSNIWRQQDAYQWNGQQGLQADGAYPIADFSPFNFETLASNTKWEKTGGITLYDTYSHALEATDINGNFASTRMDPMQRFVTASTANASYSEMAYSGMEFSTGNAFNEGGVERGNGSPSQARAHTGRYSLLTGFSKTGFRYTLNPTKADLKKLYRASVWVYVPGEAETQPELDNIQLVASVNGVDKIVHPVLQKNKSKSWYQMNLDFDPQGQETVIKCVNNSSRGVYFDDFRVHPIDANMTSYVYDNFSGELNFILDANNFYTHFEYDAMGRLIRTSREMLNFDFGPDKESFKADRILNEVIYNYGKSN